VVWAGTAEYHALTDLPGVIAHLAAEGARGVRTTCIVLGRDVVQLRTVSPAPPIPRHRVADYVRLEAPRLFRKNGAPLVTDARLLKGSSGPVLLTAAAGEDVIQAVLAGCREAGLRVVSVGPASDLLARTTERLGGTDLVSAGVVFPNGTTSEHLEIVGGHVVRSRRVLGVAPSTLNWVPALAALGKAAPAFAAAYAASVADPVLELWPDAERTVRMRGSRHRLLLIWAAAVLCWVTAGGIQVGRLLGGLRANGRELASLRPNLDSALVVRRELGASRAALATIDRAIAGRSRNLVLLEGITRAVGDSATILALRVRDTTVSLSGYAPLAARARAELERVPGLEGVRFDGPVVRETVGDNTARRDLDRFALWARYRRAP
jgi:hypothetical protein